HAHGPGFLVGYIRERLRERCIRGEPGHEHEQLLHRGEGIPIRPTTPSRCHQCHKAAATCTAINAANSHAVAKCTSDISCSPARNPGGDLGRPSIHAPSANCAANATAMTQCSATPTRV